jgi:hypothetical protein
MVLKIPYNSHFTQKVRLVIHQGIKICKVCDSNLSCSPTTNKLKATWHTHLTLNNVTGNKSKLLWWSVIAQPGRKKSGMSKGVEVDILVGCLCQKWALNVAIQLTTLKQKAKEVASLLNTGFTPSNGLID